MTIYHNLFVKNKVENLTDTKLITRCVGQQYIGVVILFNDIMKKDLIFNLLENVILSKISFGPNKFFLLVNSDENIYGYIKYKCNTIINQGGVSIGISTASKQIKDIPKIFREADMAAVYNRFFSNRNNIFVYHSNGFNEIENIVDIMSKSIDDKEYDKIVEILKTIPDIFRDKHLSMECVVLFWNQVVALIMNKMKKEIFSKEFEFMNYSEITNKFDNLYELCKYLYDYFSSLGNTTNNYKLMSNVNENFKKLLEFVNDHYNEDFNLKELASQYFINATYCCELFRKVTGITYSQYITTLRMKKACMLLRNDVNMTISEVCNKVGYNDYYYFNRIFKKVYGVTPLSYKKRGNRILK